MPKRTAKFRSPKLDLQITDEQLATAKQSSSGGCLIADAIKQQYPHLSSVTVDMATVRVSDRAQGRRYIYLTPPEAQMVLLAFDQGWSNPHTELTIKRAVQTVPITANKTGPKSPTHTRAARAERLAVLEELEATGQPMTRGQKSALTLLRKPLPPAVERPSSRGPVEVSRDTAIGPVISGGEPLTAGTKLNNPNLLRGRNRHFGARIAEPGEQFLRIVEEEADRRLAARQATAEV